LFFFGPKMLAPDIVLNTAGNRYAATHRSIPAIAVSASNKEIPYFDIHNETNPATWAAEVSVKVINAFIDSVPEGAPILPLGYGATVNIPELTGDNSELEYVQTRMTGSAHVNEAVLDPKKGIFTWENIKPYAAGVNTCVNGNCAMEGETHAVENGAVSISVYTVDYTAPTTRNTKNIMERLKPLAGWK
jgi:5'-nucleotidase